MCWGGGLTNTERLFTLLVEAAYAAHLAIQHLTLLGTDMSANKLALPLQWSEQCCHRIQATIELLLLDSRGRACPSLWTFYIKFTSKYNLYLINKDQLVLSDRDIHTMGQNYDHNKIMLLRNKIYDSERNKLIQRLITRALASISWSKEIYMLPYTPDVLPCFSTSSDSAAGEMNDGKMNGGEMNGSEELDRYWAMIEGKEIIVRSLL